MISNIISKILLISFLISSPFLFLGFGKELISVISNISFSSNKILYFLGGTILFAPVYIAGKKYFVSLWNYLTTLEHECTHAVVGLLFGKIPVGLKVTAWDGGEIKLRGGTNVWISLAPYFLPTLSILALITAFIFGWTENLYFNAVLGFTVAFHLVTNWDETSFRQTDFQQAGYLTTIIVLPIANLLVYGAILSLVVGGLTAFVTFWKNGFYNSWKIGAGIF